MYNSYTVYNNNNLIPNFCKCYVYEEQSFLHLISIAPFPIKNFLKCIVLVFKWNWKIYLFEKDNNLLKKSAVISGVN